MGTAFAQTAATAVAGTSPMAGIISFLPMILIVGLFYFIMIVPQSKERKKREALLNSIQRGDRVLTRGGVYGVVADIKEQTIILKVAENTKIEIERSYIDTVQKQA
jgi:preprotein translocase subunit YajC